MIQEGAPSPFEAPEVSPSYRTHRRFDRAARLFTEPGLHRLMGARVVVFGMGGGALHAMLPAFRLGLGGPLGGGRQVMPWIHLRDLVEVLSEAVIDERYEGAVNATAPNPVEQRELATSLGEVLGRPARLPAPALALKLVLGEAAQIVTTGQRALPTRLTELGFRYRFPALKPALADLVAPPDIRFQAAADWPDVPYLRRRRPRYLLSADVTLASGVDEVWPFFSRPENLGVLTPATMAADILQVPDQLSAGALVEYRIRVGPVPMRWRSRIDEWEPGEGFADAQLKGPYACWYHEHGFRPADGGDATLVTDRVWYAPPLGPLGALANTLLVRPMLRDIFSYRRQALALRFGGRRDGP